MDVYMAYFTSIFTGNSTFFPGNKSNFIVSLCSFLLLFSQAVYSDISGYSIGLKHLNEGNIPGAIDVWTQLADVGDMNSQYSLGVLLEQEGEHQSHEQAIKYLRLASKQGKNKAQYHLASD